MGRITPTGSTLNPQLKGCSAGPNAADQRASATPMRKRSTTNDGLEGRPCALSGQDLQARHVSATDTRLLRRTGERSAPLHLRPHAREIPAAPETDAPPRSQGPPTAREPGPVCVHDTPSSGVPILGYEYGVRPGGTGTCWCCGRPSSETCKTAPRFCGSVHARGRSSSGTDGAAVS